MEARIQEVMKYIQRTKYMIMSDRNELYSDSNDTAVERICEDFDVYEMKNEVSLESINQAEKILLEIMDEIYGIEN